MNKLKMSQLVKEIDNVAKIYHDTTMPLVKGTCDVYVRTLINDGALKRDRSSLFCYWDKLKGVDIDDIHIRHERFQDLLRFDHSELL